MSAPSLSFDPAKNERNIAERGLSFTLVDQFVRSGAKILADTRRDYGEPRYKALGLIQHRLHALVFTPRAGLVHVISLRKANRREISLHEKATLP